jgi:hypothetical protein
VKSEPEVPFVNHSTSAPDPDEEYISKRPSVTYFTYFADLAQESPSKTVRLQTILFLQGSAFYDINAVADRLERIELLTYETAIVLGRVRGDKSDGSSLSDLRISVPRCSAWQAFQGTQVVSSDLEGRCLGRNILLPRG